MRGVYVRLGYTQAVCACLSLLACRDTQTRLGSLVSHPLRRVRVVVCACAVDMHAPTSVHVHVHTCVQGYPLKALMKMKLESLLPQPFSAMHRKHVLVSGHGGTLASACTCVRGWAFHSNTYGIAEVLASGHASSMHQLTFMIWARHTFFLLS